MDLTTDSLDEVDHSIRDIWCKPDAMICLAGHTRLQPLGWPFFSALPPLPSAFSFLRWPTSQLYTRAVATSIV